MQRSLSPMQSYYAARASEYDRVYQKPERHLTSLDRAVAALCPCRHHGVGSCVRHRLLDSVHRSSRFGCRRAGFVTGNLANRQAASHRDPCRVSRRRRLRNTPVRSLVRRGVRRVLVFPCPARKAARVLAGAQLGTCAGCTRRAAGQSLRGGQFFSGQRARRARQHVSKQESERWLDTSSPQELPHRGATPWACASWIG